MWNALKESVLKPLGRRVGTALATFLMFGGDFLCDNFQACGLVTQSGAQLVATYVVAVAFLILDLVVGWVERKRIERKTVNRMAAL